MHRLSKISASFASKRNDSTDSNGDKIDKRFSRPTILQLSYKEESMDGINECGKQDEWYEMVTAVTPPIDEIRKTDQKMNNETNDMLRKTSNMINGLNEIDLEPDNAAEIEVVEQSLTTLVDNFRSGRMCALDEEKLKMMRKAREKMENLTAFHVKLHKIQAPNFSTFRYDMSFRATDVKEEERMADTFTEEKNREVIREQS
ncbi:unnamed protein product [Acanthocheilonema viteae]|uniref:Uncharacterized protein n=1 Tax=Acanthocheilonema viteae TaxID=6277 RepID=A0A498SPX5_ACAVI|nr:unnamed protein product [Acanthocheilonema viteae]